MLTESDNLFRAGGATRWAVVAREGEHSMGSSSVICPKCRKPGFSWGRRRCMYCANPSEDFDPRIVHEFPPENDRIYLRLLADAKRIEEIEPITRRKGVGHV